MGASDSSSIWEILGAYEALLAARLEAQREAAAMPARVPAASMVTFESGVGALSTTGFRAPAWQLMELSALDDEAAER